MPADSPKVRSFRIDDETLEKFKEIAEKTGGNQQETLAKLIDAYELQTGKAALPEKMAAISQFESLTGTLTRMFMASLEENGNLAVTIRNQYDAQLRAKDAAVASMQEKKEAAEKEKESRRSNC